MGQSRVVASVLSAPPPRLGLPHPREAQNFLLSHFPPSHPELRSDHINSPTVQTPKGPQRPSLSTPSRSRQRGCNTGRALARPGSGQVYW